MNPNNTQLKSAEEIAERLNEISTQRSIWPTDVKEHLLNAFKAGMTEAADIPLSFITGECVNEPCDRCEQNKIIAQAILSARDKKETL